MELNGLLRKKETKLYIQFAGFKYRDNKACLICEHVFEFEQPKIIVHDHDGWLQFLCGRENHDPALSKTVAITEIIDRLPKEEDLRLLGPGQYAELTNSGEWRVSIFSK